MDLVRLDDAQQKQGRRLWSPSASLVVRNSDYHGIVAAAHDRLGELIKSFTEEDANIYIHNPPASLKRQLEIQRDAGTITLDIYSRKI